MKNEKLPQAISSVNKFLIALYITLTFLEPYVTVSSGSLLKYFGLGIMVIWLMTTVVFRRGLLFKLVHLFLILWVGLNAVSLQWTINRPLGWEFLLSIGNMAVMFFVVGQYQWNERERVTLLAFYMLTAAIFSFLVVTSGSSYGNENLRTSLSINGKTFDPNLVGGLIAPASLVGLHLAFSKRSSILLRISGGISIGLILVAMVVLSSRGTIVGFGLGFAAYLITSISAVTPNGRGRIRILAGLTFFLVLVIAVAISLKVNFSVLSRLNLFDAIKSGGSGRTLIWSNGVDVALQKPIFGWGIGSWLSLSPTKQVMHNTYLLVLVDVGVVGLLAFAGFLYTMLRRAVLRKSVLCTAILVCTFGIIFFLDTYESKIFWNTMLISEVILTLSKERGEIRIFDANSSNL